MLHRGKFFGIARRSWFLPAPAPGRGASAELRSIPC